MEDRAQQLIQQQETTILLGEVPVLRAAQYNPEEVATIAANFLRSGCPAVQLLFAPHLPTPNYMDELSEWFRGIEIEGEEFRPVWTTNDKVLSITRI